MKDIFLLCRLIPEFKTIYFRTMMPGLKYADLMYECIEQVLPKTLYYSSRKVGKLMI